MFFRVVCRVVAFFPNVLEILTVLVNMLSGPFVSGNFPQPKTVNRWRMKWILMNALALGRWNCRCCWCECFLHTQHDGRPGVCTRRDPELPKGSSVSFGFFCLASPLHRHYGTNVVYFCICLNKKNKTAICDSPCRWSTSPGFWQTLSRWKLNRNGCDFSAYLVLKGILFVHSVGDLQCVRMCVYPCAAG